MIRFIGRKIVESLKYKETRPKLGRWSLDHTESMIYRKADMTNEDHCGICEKMRLDYIDKNIKLQNIKNQQ